MNAVGNRMYPEAILTGQQPIDLSIAKLTRMLDLPIGWKDQHALLMN